MAGVIRRLRLEHPHADEQEIVDGSVATDEPRHLRRNGFLVVTFDTQQQGLSQQLLRSTKLLCSANAVSRQPRRDQLSTERRIGTGCPRRRQACDRVPSRIVVPSAC